MRFCLLYFAKSGKKFVLRIKRGQMSRYIHNNHITMLTFPIRRKHIPVAHRSVSARAPFGERTRGGR